MKTKTAIGATKGAGPSKPINKEWGNKMCPQLPNVMPDDFSVKTISIDKSTVSEQLLKDLNGYWTYKDTDMQEHLYSCDVLEDIEQITTLGNIERNQLLHIKQLCDNHNASYFRIVNY